MEHKVFILSGNAIYSMFLLLICVVAITHTYIIHMLRFEIKMDIIMDILLKLKDRILRTGLTYCHFRLYVPKGTYIDFTAVSSVTLPPLQHLAHG